MKIKHIAVLFVLVQITSGISAQSKPALPTGFYSIDNKFPQSLKKYPDRWPTTVVNSMKINVFGDSYAYPDEPIECPTRAYLKHDTITIICIAGAEGGLGYFLRLFKDSCTLAAYAYSDVPSYKYNKTENGEWFMVFLPSVTQKIILSHRPQFKAGESIEGLVQLKSVPYYDNDRQYVIELSAYFKTASLKISQ